MSHPEPAARPLRGCSTLFFDLDGTLTDPRDGITRCFQYALECLGRSSPSQAQLTHYIGPPLRQAFPRLLSSDDDELIEAAIRHYRRRYADVGLFENEVYVGIPELLAQLQTGGFALYVVTCKPTVFARRIVQHFSLDTYFMGVFGPELDGRFDDKTELIRHLLDKLTLEPEQTVMIGDRDSDIAAGKANGVRTIGVTYGFGPPEELTAAKPDRICRRPSEIHGVLKAGF